MRDGFQNGFPVPGSQTQNQQFNNLVSLFNMTFNASGYPQNINMVPPPMFAPPFHWNHANIPANIQNIQVQKSQTEDKNTTPNLGQAYQIQQKVKLPRCSVCLKKIQPHQLFKCPKCIKTFHRSCQEGEQECLRCQQKQKLKQLKRDKKNVKKTQKKYLPLSSFNQTGAYSQLIGDAHQLEGQALAFAIKFPYYLSGKKIVYPVQDSLFSEYSTLLKADISSSRPKSIPLPHYYGNLLQIWNTIATFPIFFGVASQIRVKQIESKMIADQIDPQFFKIILKLAKFNLNDIINDKFESYRETSHFAYVSLIKFCVESGFVDKILKFSWPKLIRKIFELLIKQKVEQSTNQSVIKSIVAKDNLGDFKFFENLDDRFQFCRSLCSNAVQTTSFRNLLNQKSQFGKENNKQKNELLQTRKIKDNTLTEIKDRQKELIKQQKKIRKNGRDTQSDRALREIANQERQLDIKKNQLFDEIKQIDNQLESVSGFSGFSNVYLIGRDKDKNSYWVTIDHKDRIFVTEGDNWGYYPVKMLQQLLGSLNKNAIRERQLYQAIKQYRGFELQNQQVSDGMDIELPEKETMRVNNSISDDNSFNFQNLPDTSIKTIRAIILQCQRRVTRYLQERNARWANPNERARYIQAISNIQTVADFITELKPFNQKICVVQVEYKIILQDSAQQIDSKTRKIQTKIWGINEKYKHNWYDFAKECSSVSDLFFLVSVLYLNIEKYVGKMRKLRKQYEQVKGPTNLIKSDSARNDGMWQDQCQLCNGVGDLLCCDICPKVFHNDCIGISSIPSKQFKCQACLKKKSTRSQVKRAVVSDSRKK